MEKIMIVDDEEDIRLVTKRALEAKRYKVVLAKDGDECLELVKTEKPDLILMDILMPGTPVDQVILKLNKFKIIIFSVITLDEKNIAETGKKVPHKGDYPNVVDYITKPMDLKNLLSKVKKALN